MIVLDRLWVVFRSSLFHANECFYVPQSFSWEKQSPLTIQSHQGKSYITLSTLDLEKRKSSLIKDLEKNKAEAEKFTEKTKPGKVENNQKEKERIEEELQFLEQHLQVGRQVVPLSGTLTLEFGGTSENVYAGMDEEFRRYQPAILTWYETAQHAFDRGASWQNMGGIENSLDVGLYHFKSKFTP